MLSKKYKFNMASDKRGDEVMTPNSTNTDIVSIITDVNYENEGNRR